MNARVVLTISLWVSWASAPISVAESPVGYYRQPAIHGDTLVFVAEGDLWRVPVEGGVATRLTSHPGPESHPAISPDGTTVAFTATYEGPTEIYSMPLAGGLPTRRTFGGGQPASTGWTADGRLLYTTDAHSTLPAWQLVAQSLDPESEVIRDQLIPLAQAADGWYDDDGSTLFFTRLRFQGSHTKRYRGGTAQNIWRFSTGGAEAVPLTSDYAGTSKRPMGWNGRVYFVSDRDGTMNLWSMARDGSDLLQHTDHDGWDVKSPDLHAGRIVYRLGADLRRYDIAKDRDESIPVSLNSDLDQLREHWVDDPMTYLSAAHASPDGDRLVVTARGQVFVFPRKQGRLVTVTRNEGVRYRDARFMPDGTSLVALSDESGEVELWRLPADGVGPREQWTRNGEVLRWAAFPSPDGRYLAHDDKNQRLHVFDTKTGRNREIDSSKIGRFGGMTWSADGKWLAYVAPAHNYFSRIKLYNVESGESTFVTTDRFDSFSPAFSPDGKWLYFLSDRNLRSVVRSPWGSYQPEPYLDKRTLIFQLALTVGSRSPFDPRNELQEETEKTGDEKVEKEEKKSEEGEQPPSEVRIDFDGLATRLIQLPVDPGNYRGLTLNGEALFWRSRRPGDTAVDLVGAKISRDRDAKGNLEVETVVPEIDDFELAGNGKRLLVLKQDEFYIIDAAPEETELKDVAVDQSRWRISVDPREEWRQMFDDAWRLERDYFYDRGMHGVDWEAMHAKYLPLVDRVTARDELSDLVAQMVSELSALHTFVRGGEHRSGKERVEPATLGAKLVRDDEAGGFRVDHVYASDPDVPRRASPLAHPGVNVTEGDVIESVNGVRTLSVADIGALLRTQADRQTLLRIRPGDGSPRRDVIVRPISLSQARDLRYHEWEYTRRLEVEQSGNGEIGYVHLRAMGGENFTEWATDFYPAFNRKGLIVDVRNNRGGNIDSWILGRLLRRPWFYWSQRVGRAPMWNMQFAFGGHVVVICNERTASDGEAFTEGIRRLGIGSIVGTRTWGGEIWLTSSNDLVDRGIATAAEFGVFSPDGEWLIEGWGVEPDVVVDNLPHETFNGRDAQLEAAIEFLRRKIATEPVEIPEVPTHPDLSHP